MARWINECGIAAIRPIEKKPKRIKKYLSNEEKQKMIDVCCRCTKKQCTGTADCVRKQMRKELLNEN